MISEQARSPGRRRTVVTLQRWEREPCRIGVGVAFSVLFVTAGGAHLQDEGGSCRAFLAQNPGELRLEEFACLVVGQPFDDAISPALVSTFMVTKNFLDAKIHQHLGQDNK